MKNKIVLAATLLVLTACEPAALTGAAISDANGNTNSGAGGAAASAWATWDRRVCLPMTFLVATSGGNVLVNAQNDCSRRVVNGEIVISCFRKGAATNQNMMDGIRQQLNLRFTQFALSYGQETLSHNTAASALPDVAFSAEYWGAPWAGTMSTVLYHGLDYSGPCQ